MHSHFFDSLNTAKEYLGWRRLMVGIEMRKAITMKTSISRRVIVVATLSLALSGAVAFAEDDGGKTHARSAPRGDSGPGESSAAPAAPSARGAANVYRTTPPRYPGTSALPHPAGQLYPRTRAFTNKPVIHRQPPASIDEGKSTARDVRPNQPPATAVQRSGERAGNWSHSNRSGKSGLDRQSAARLRDWHGKGDNFATAAAKHHDHQHHHHNRDWWRHHCDVIVLVGWGYWAWDSGWWYPAWGYNSVYSTYAFDEPIYGYEDLPPDQVIANVQGALQDLGYYLDEVDGVLGSTTRAALENYQRDYGLPVTGTIDRETLESIGFIE
jgi:hypothetical protein